MQNNMRKRLSCNINADESMIQLINKRGQINGRNIRKQFEEIL